MWIKQARKWQILIMRKLYIPFLFQISAQVWFTLTAICAHDQGLKYGTQAPSCDFLPNSCFRVKGYHPPTLLCGHCQYDTQYPNTSNEIIVISSHFKRVITRNNLIPSCNDTEYF